MAQVYKNACACRHCGGESPVECPTCGARLQGLICPSCGLTELGGATLLEVLVEGKYVHCDALEWTGGRHPDLVVLEAGEIFAWQSASGRITAPPEANLDDVRLSLPASRHGCWKVRKHQRLLVCGRLGVCPDGGLCSHPEGVADCDGITPGSLGCDYRR